MVPPSTAQPRNREVDDGGLTAADEVRARAAAIVFDREHGLLTWPQIAEKYGAPMRTLQYQVRAYRKELGDREPSRPLSATELLTRRSRVDVDGVDPEAELQALLAVYDEPIAVFRRLLAEDGVQHSVRIAAGTRLVALMERRYSVMRAIGAVPSNLAHWDSVDQVRAVAQLFVRRAARELSDDALHDLMTDLEQHMSALRGGTPPSRTPMPSERDGDFTTTYEVIDHDPVG